jgi:hypothetical protein
MFADYFINDVNRAFRKLNTKSTMDKTKGDLRKKRQGVFGINIGGFLN